MKSSNTLVVRALSILEAIASTGRATARTVSERLEIPLPTVYRLLSTLSESGYLIYIKTDGQFELGPKCFDLGLAFHSQVIAPTPIRKLVDELHRTLGMAAYFATFRGTEIILTYCSDCQEHPRLRPLRFGFHESAHATAFGKILLANMERNQRDEYLRARGLPSLTAQTIVDHTLFEKHLAEVMSKGIAWEFDEFIHGQTCAAVPVRNGVGMTVGAIAISKPSAQAHISASRTTNELKRFASLCSKFLRSGQQALQDSCDNAIDSRAMRTNVGRDPKRGKMGA